MIPGTSLKDPDFMFGLSFHSGKNPLIIRNSQNSESLCLVNEYSDSTQRNNLFFAPHCLLEDSWLLHIIPEKQSRILSKCISSNAPGTGYKKQFGQ